MGSLKQNIVGYGPTAMLHARHNSTDHPCRCRTLRLGPHERERELGETLISLQRLTEGHDVAGVATCAEENTMSALADHATELALELGMRDVISRPIRMWLIEVV